MNAVKVKHLLNETKNVHIIRNFTPTVASCISIIMPGNFKVVCIKQVFHFNHTIYYMYIESMFSYLKCHHKFSA